MTAFVRAVACENMNHRRRDAPVGHCPQCGNVVNAQIASMSCGEDKHAVARRRQSIFCVDCGMRLVASR